MTQEMTGNATMPAFAPGPQAGLTIERLADGRLRQLLLRSSQGSVRTQDLIDAAELAVQAGYREIAASLYGLVFLRLGPKSGAELFNTVDARTGLWGLPPTPIAEAASGFSIDLAIEELRSLVAVAPALAPERPDITPILADDGLSPTADGRDGLSSSIELATRACALLRGVPALLADGELGAALREQADGILASPATVLDENVDQPIEPLAALFAFAQLREFVIATRELLFVETPHAFLFDRSLAYYAAALGACFANVPMLIRDAGDLFGLIAAASPGAPTYQDDETWAVLLSGFLPDDQTLELIDELADRGMTKALNALLARTALRRRTGRSLEIAWRVRDAGIDMSDYGLAIDAQRLVVHWRPYHGSEWRILGDLLPVGSSQAVAAYRRADELEPLIQTPPSPGKAAAIETVGRPVRGYGTSLARYRVRLGRLAAYRSEAQPNPGELP